MKFLIDKYLKLIIIFFIIINIFIVLKYEVPCPWKSSFSIDCAGCGATRMIKSILKLDFYQAFRYNPLLFIFIIVSIIYLIYIKICKIKKINYYKITDKDLYILLIIIIVFMILRNVPGFEFLKPTLVK